MVTVEWYPLGEQKRGGMGWSGLGEGRSTMKGKSFLRGKGSMRKACGRKKPREFEELRG